MNDNSAPVGVKGWLLVFVIATAIGLVINLVMLGGYPSAFAELSLMPSYAAGLASALAPLLWFEVFQYVSLAVAAAVLIVFVFQRKRVAKPLAIALLLSPIIFALVDYVWAATLFESYNMNVQEELSATAQNAGRSLIPAVIWITYLSVSKRVKATLTNA